MSGRRIAAKKMAKALRNRHTYSAEPLTWCRRTVTASPPTMYGFSKYEPVRIHKFRINCFFK